MGESLSGGIDKSMASGQKKSWSQRNLQTSGKLKQKLNGPVCILVGLQDLGIA